jgi:hypothetical protein
LLFLRSVVRRWVALTSGFDVLGRFDFPSFDVGWFPPRVFQTLMRSRSHKEPKLMAGAGAQAGIWSFGSGLNSILNYNSYTTGSSKWPISIFYSKNYETLLFNLEAVQTVLTKLKSEPATERKLWKLDSFGSATLITNSNISTFSHLTFTHSTSSRDIQ